MIKPIAFINNIEGQLAYDVTSISTQFYLPHAACLAIDAVITGGAGKAVVFVTLEKADKSSNTVLEISSVNTTSDYVVLTSGTVGANYVIGDTYSLRLPAEVMRQFRQVIYREFGPLASGVGFTVFAENEIHASVNTGSHPITVDFTYWAPNNTTSAKLVLNDYGASPKGTFSWIDASSSYVFKWQGGSAPAFGTGTILVIDLVADPVTLQIIGTWTSL